MANAKNTAAKIAKTKKVEKKEEPMIEDNDSLISEDGEVNLPKVIGKVRKFVSSLDEVSRLIETSEMDLDDKYQIIIEIDKNA